MTLDYNLLGNVITTTVVFPGAVTWIISTIIAFLSVALVSRDINDWPTLTFPMMVAWSIAGLHMSLILMIASGIVFVISTLSIKGMAKILTTKSIAPETFSTKAAWEKNIYKAPKRTALPIVNLGEQSLKLQTAEYKDKLKKYQRNLSQIRPLRSITNDPDKGDRIYRQLIAFPSKKTNKDE